MKIILAVICFLSMILHGLFGYYLFINGESVFEPDNMIVALHKKTQSSPDIYTIFAKPKSAQKAEGFRNPLDKEESNLTKVGEVQTGSTDNSNNEASISPENPVKAETVNEAVHPMLPSGTVQIGTVQNPSKPTEIIRGQASEASSNQDQKQSEQVSGTKPEFLPFSTGWSGFLQVENALITVTLFLLGFSVCCVKGRGKASRWVFLCNLMFWIALSCTIWFFHPEKTPFAMMNLKFKFPEWYLILGASSLAALLSLLLYLNAFRKPIEAQPQKVEKSADEQPKQPAPQEKKSRFSFSHKPETKDNTTTKSEATPENSTPEKTSE